MKIFAFALWQTCFELLSNHSLGSSFAEKFFRYYFKRVINAIYAEKITQTRQQTKSACVGCDLDFWLFFRKFQKKIFFVVIKNKFLEMLAYHLSKVFGFHSVFVIVFLFSDSLKVLSPLFFLSVLESDVCSYRKTFFYLRIKLGNCLLFSSFNRIVSIYSAIICMQHNKVEHLWINVMIVTDIIFKHCLAQDYCLEIPEIYFFFSLFLW